MDHKYFLRVALEEAKRGRGFCAPNPSVGAIAVKEGKILAKGFHLGPGLPHAEQSVLSQLPLNLEGVILYVTLEPCNHWGRTPPCVDAITQYGIKEVIYGFTDPNPMVAFKNTPKLLQDKGVIVAQVSLPEINEFYKSYCYAIKNQTPFVTVKLAVSLDGKIASAKKERVLLSNEACFKFTHENRCTTDWILTTAETIIKDNPQFTARFHNIYSQQLDFRRGASCESTGVYMAVNEDANTICNKAESLALCEGRGSIAKSIIKKKRIAILDRQLRLPQNALIFETAEKILIFYDEKQKILFETPNCQYIPIKTNNYCLDIDDVLKKIYEHGAHDVWVEAGGTLFTHLHLEGLVQRTFLYICPKILGQNAFNGYQDNAVFNRQHSVSWRILDDNIVLILDWVDSSKRV